MKGTTTIRVDFKKDKRLLAMIAAPRPENTDMERRGRGTPDPVRFDRRQPQGQGRMAQDSENVPRQGLTNDGPSGQRSVMLGVAPLTSAGLQAVLDRLFSAVARCACGSPTAHWLTADFNPVHIRLAPDSVRIHPTSGPPT